MEVRYLGGHEGVAFVQPGEGTLAQLHHPLLPTFVELGLCATHAHTDMTNQLIAHTPR